MRNPDFDPGWPEDWKTSYLYDQEEVFHLIKNHGYAYMYARRMQETLRLVQRAARPPATILDVAAAQGNFSLALAEMGYKVTWNDLRAGLADYVRLKYEYGELGFAPGNVFDLGFANRFDIVLITEIIEHVAHPDDFLMKVGQLVKPGGHIVMTTPNGGYFLNDLPKFSECADPSQYEYMQFMPNSDGHIFLLHEDEISGLASKAGLEIEEIQLHTNPLTTGHLKTELLLKILPRALVESLDVLTTKAPGFVRRRVHTAMSASFIHP